MSCCFSASAVDEAPSLLSLEQFAPVQYIRGTSPEDKQRILPLLNSLMKRNNGVRGLVSLLSFPNDDAVVDQAVWALLMACAKDQKFCRQAVDADALPALAALLRRLPPASGGNVARCLHFLALRSPERCAAMQAAGVLPALEEALGTPEKRDFGLAELAAFALKAVTGASADCCREIADGGILPALVSLLRHSTVGAATKAAGALAHLAMAGDGVREKIITAGALPNVIVLLNHSSAPLVRKASGVLHALASGHVAHVILKTGALAKIVEKLNNQEVHKIDRSLRALVILAGASNALAAKIRESSTARLEELEQHPEAVIKDNASRLQKILAACTVSV